MKFSHIILAFSLLGGTVQAAVEFPEKASPSPSRIHHPFSAQSGKQCSATAPIIFGRNRDRLVYDVFVQGAPLFPINSLMTHGTIITNSRPANAMSKDPANCLKEMRAAFGCGFALQEIYEDRELMMHQNGKP